MMTYVDDVSKKPYGLAIVVKQGALIWSTADLKILKMSRDLVTRRYNVVDGHEKSAFLADIRRNRKELPGSGSMIFFDISISKTSMAEWCVVFKSDCRKATAKEASDLMERLEERDEDTVRFPSAKKLPRGFSYGDWPDEEPDAEREYKEELRGIKREKFESEIGLEGHLIILQRKLEEYKNLLREAKDENEKISLQEKINSLSKKMSRLQLDLSLIKGRKTWYDKSKVNESDSDQVPLA